MENLNNRQNAYQNCTDIQDQINRIDEALTQFDRLGIDISWWLPDAEVIVIRDRENNYDAVEFDSERNHMTLTVARVYHDDPTNFTVTYEFSVTLYHLNQPFKDAKVGVLTYFTNKDQFLDVWVKNVHRLEYQKNK